MIELNYKVYGENGEDVIILHGLFGSLDNWQTIARELSATHKVWVPDQRNHGRSPHTEDISYSLMAGDLLDLMNLHHIDRANIIGHSMGGKVAMTFALLHPARVQRLVVADIGPVKYVGDHLPLFEAMLRLPLDQLQERSEADAILSQTIPSAAVRQFLLKNLVRDNRGFFWKPNLKLLHQRYEALMGFDAMGRQYTGPTWFLKGSKSAYIQNEHLEYYRTIFPKAKLIVIEDAGHWLHAEQPQRFLDAVRAILQDRI